MPALPLYTTCVAVAATSSRVKVTPSGVITFNVLEMHTSRSSTQPTFLLKSGWAEEREAEPAEEKEEEEEEEEEEEGAGASRGDLAPLNSSCRYRTGITITMSLALTMLPKVSERGERAEGSSSPPPPPPLPGHTTGLTDSIAEALLW